MQGVDVCGLAQMPSVFLIQVQLCVKCWARVDQLNIYYSDELGLWQTCASGADETSQCLFFFFWMHANLNGVVREFGMLFISIRMLNAGKWAYVSKPDAEWEQTAVLQCITTSGADALETEMWNKMIDVTFVCLRKGARN